MSEALTNGSRDPAATFDLALSQYFDEMRRLVGRDD